MEGHAAQFEAAGNRLGFRVVEDTSNRLLAVWQGARFPAFLCLGIALALLFVSVPILQAIHLRGFIGPAGSLWYFPVMNAVLLGIALFLLSLKRTFHFDHAAQKVTLSKRSLLRKARFSAAYREVKHLALGIDHVDDGFAVAGSSAAVKFPVPSLRLHLTDGETVLLDRGSIRRLRSLAVRLSEQMQIPLETDAAIQG